MFTQDNRTIVLFEVISFENHASHKIFVEFDVSCSLDFWQFCTCTSCSFDFFTRMSEVLIFCT